MTVDEFLERCEGVRPAGNGFVAVCPSHEDREASLGITEGDDGRVLLQCYAGCQTNDIVEAMGLKLRDLFANTIQHDLLPEAIYSYTDELGAELYQAVRMPGKKFRQRHLDPESPDAKDDGWVWNLEGVRRVPFRLPELIETVKAGGMVYIVEGEKDALRITAETGRFATCNPMGAGKWRDEYNGFFSGARVTIVQDRDEPGRRHAQRVKEALGPLTVYIKILQAKRGKDMSDHFDAGFPMEELLIPRAMPARGIVSASAMADAGLEYLTYRPTDLPGWPLIAGVEGSIVRQGRIYAGGAYTGDGKSTLALQGTRAICEMGTSVGYFTLEMSETDLRNRLLAQKGIPLRLLEKPWELKQDPQMLALYHLGIEELREWKLDIIYDTSLKVERIVQDTLDREYDFVVIDHIHRIGFSDRRNLEEQIKMITNLSLDANIPILVLCQLRRYQRGKDMVAYPPPVLQDFRETEVLGNEASIAFAIWRSRDQEGLRYVGDTSQFRILKNRHPTTRKDQSGHVEELLFNRATQLYTPGGISSVYTEATASPAAPAPEGAAGGDLWQGADEAHGLHEGDEWG